MTSITEQLAGLGAIIIVLVLVVYQMFKVVGFFKKTDDGVKTPRNELMDDIKKCQDDCRKCREALPEKYVLYDRYKEDYDKVVERLDELLKRSYE